jgi:hypothetical protein
MNPVIIGLGVVLVVMIVYMIFGDYLSGTTSVAKEQDMTKSIAAIPAENLSVPNSQRFSYGLWIYVNQWPTATSSIFKRAKDMELKLDGTTGKLIVDVKTSTDTTGTTTIVTNNFPLQKWTHIIVSFDNTTMDLYLDGKLVKSVSISSHTPNSSSAINFTPISGGSAFMSKFTRKPQPIDPQTAWDDYMGGSGTGKNGDGKVNVNLSFLKDNIEAKKFTIW